VVFGSGPADGEDAGRISGVDSTATRSAQRTGVGGGGGGGGWQQGKRIGIGFEVEKTLTVERDKQTYQWKERWLVIRSDNHAKRQKKKLLKRLETAEKELKKLYPKATEGKEELAARAAKVIENHGVSDFLSVSISDRITYRKRYLKRGRPEPTSPYGTAGDP